MATSVKKLSTKTIIGGPADVRKALGDKKEVALFDVFGMANGWKPGESNYGPYVAFKGEFGAVNKETGEEFRSSTCFLPDEITPVLQNALDNNHGQTVKFGLSISARKRDDLTIGYEYTIKPIVNVVEADAMAELRAAMGLKAASNPEQKQLPGKEPEKKDEKKKK